MGLLGQMLIDRGAISVEQLHTALSASQQGNRRLGSCLVDNGFIDEHALLEALAEQHSVPYVSEPMLANFLGSMNNPLMPRTMLRRMKAIPFRQVRDRIQVAMSNPDDTKVIDRIANYTQLHVEPFIASDRAIDLLIDRTNRRSPDDFSEEEMTVEAAEERWSPEWESLWSSRTDPEALLNLNGRPESMSAVLVAKFPSLVPVTPVEGSVGLGASGNHDLMLRLASVRTASEVAEILADFAARRLDRVCVFAAHHGKISGWMSRGINIGAAEFHSFSTLGDLPSVFWEVDENDRYIGPIPKGPVNDEVCRLIGAPVPTEVLVVPLCLNGRAKGYLLGDIPAFRVPRHIQGEMAAAARAAGLALEAVLRGRGCR